MSGRAAPASSAARCTAMTAATAASMRRRLSLCSLASRAPRLSALRDVLASPTLGGAGQIDPACAGPEQELDQVVNVLLAEDGAGQLPRIETAEGAVTVATKLQAALEEPFVLEGLGLDVEASIGVALYPEHGNDPPGAAAARRHRQMWPRRPTPDSCCSTPAWISTAPDAWPCWASCAAPSTSTSCCCTTSPRSTPAPAKSSGSRRWCAGNTPTTA